MGRAKSSLKRIENLGSRVATYSKRKDVIVKKARELSILCDINCALLMFSPNGQVTTFASSGRVEDIFLRFLKRPDELKGGPIRNEEYLTNRLKQVKKEATMIEKMAKVEALEETLYKLNRRQAEAVEKLRFYNPNVEKMTSLCEVSVYQQYLEKALERIEESKEKLFLDGIEQQMDDMIEDNTPAAEVDEDPVSTSDNSSTTTNVVERKQAPAENIFWKQSGPELYHFPK